MNNLHGDPQSPSTRLYRTGFFSIILMVAGLLVYLWCHIQTMNQGQILEQLRVKRQALLQDQERLQVRISGLKQSTRIRDIAMQKLGMVFPSDPPRNLYLKPVPGATNVN